MKNTKEPQKTTSKNKIFLILGAIIAIIIIIILTLYFNNNNQKNKKRTEKEPITNNTNEGVIKDQQIEGLTLTQTSLIYTNGMSTLETTVTNTNDSPYYLEEFHIIIKDENGNDIINYEDEEGKIINYLVGYVGDEIKTKESRKIETSIDYDITSSAYTITYEIAK